MRGRSGGDVAFYVKKDLRVRYVKHPKADIKQMWLTVKANGQSVIIGSAYRPNWVNIDAITDTLVYFLKYDNVVLLGDFNINMFD